MRVVHGLAVEFRAMIRRVLAASWEAAVIALAVVEMVIHMAVKMPAPMKPRPRADKDTAGEPLRSVVPVRCALVRRSFVVTIGTFRLRADFHCYLRRRLGRRCQEQTGRNRHSRNKLPNLHSFPFVLEGDATANGCFGFSDIAA
jgi:hypothetical protein